MGAYKISSGKRVLILLAPGFEERQIIHHTSCMRESGVPTSLVGLSTQSVSGQHGIAVQPDCSLNDLPRETDYSLVLMSGGYQYVSSLLADPRVHQLLSNILKQEGYIAANELAGAILPHTNAKALLQGCHFITQNNMDLNEFTQHLISLVID
jgi:4-methyl-5(b-hydroxyethyl)-thiazole monophosphate biosynthesis